MYNLNRVRLQHGQGASSFSFTTMLTSSQNRKSNEKCFLLPPVCVSCVAVLRKLEYRKLYNNKYKNTLHLPEWNSRRKRNTVKSPYHKLRKLAPLVPHLFLNLKKLNESNLVSALFFLLAYYIQNWPNTHHNQNIRCMVNWFRQKVFCKLMWVASFFDQRTNVKRLILMELTHSSVVCCSPGHKTSELGDVHVSVGVTRLPFLRFATGSAANIFFALVISILWLWSLS